MHKSLDEFEIQPDATTGFHGNRLGYSGKNGVISFSQMFLIRSFSYLQVTMTCMRAWMSSKFGQILLWTTELAAHERMKKNHLLLIGKRCHHIFSAILIGSFSYLQVMRTCIRAWISLKFSQMRPLVSMANR